MKLVDLSLREYLDRVDSKNATPGGGSVAALSLAEGISLLRMVAHLSLSKKKFTTAKDEAKMDYQNRMDELAQLKVEALKLVDLDSAAFDEIMFAFSLPKISDEEIELRNNKIKEATIEATIVPLNTAKLAATCLEVARHMYKFATKSATSDFGVGIVMVKAAFTSASLNVLTNMQGFPDLDVKTKYIDEVNTLTEQVNEISDDLINKVYNKLND